MIVHIKRGTPKSPPVKGKVVHCKHAKFDIYVGRHGSRYGFQDSLLYNPYPINDARTREQSIAQFEKYARERIAQDPDFRRAVEHCHGKTLGCWCAPLACHGSVLLKLAAELRAAVGKE